MNVRASSMTAAIVGSICSARTRSESSQRLWRSASGPSPEQLVEPLVRGGEDGLVGVRRPHAVAALHLVCVGDGLACEHARVGTQADHLVAQPTVFELAEQPFRVGDELLRVDRRLGVDGGLQLRRAEVRVHVPLDVAVELQPQPDVTLGDGFGHPVSLRIARSPRRCTRCDGRASPARRTRPTRRPAPAAPAHTEAVLLVYPSSRPSRRRGLTRCTRTGSPAGHRLCSRTSALRRT